MKKSFLKRKRATSNSFTNEITKKETNLEKKVNSNETSKDSKRINNVNKQAIYSIIAFIVTNFNKM